LQPALQFMDKFCCLIQFQGAVQLGTMSFLAPRASLLWQLQQLFERDMQDRQVSVAVAVLRVLGSAA